jgi:hypothetical protein
MNPGDHVDEAPNVLARLVAHRSPDDPGQRDQRLAYVAAGDHPLRASRGPAP